MSFSIGLRRRVAQTALDLPVFGFGAAHIGELFSTVPEATARATLETAWAKGVRYYDTAPWYGRGLSEHRLGGFLRTMPRAEFQVTTSVSPADAVAESARTDGITVMSDTGDSVGGGAGGDSNELLAAFLAHGGPRALIPLVHPPIAQIVDEVEVGQTVTLDVGGAITGWWEPVSVTGVVRAVEAHYVTPEPKAVRHVSSSHALPFRNSLVCGATVALEVANVMLVITELPGPAGRARDQYDGLGIDVDAYDAAVLKTASNFQYWVEDLTTNVVRANTTGPTQSDMAGLPWTRIPRPVYPLNADLNDWRR
jgi:microcystin degradation protein MlrC